uniref:Uncharacterized protein n=1 Tax=Panagrolaimus sp. PS1159 TaxID=55785 RepID=A0AC35EUM5_9BILA
MYYFGTMISWGIFGYYFGRILMSNVVNFFSKHEKPYHNTVNEILLLITLTSIVFINVFIGILSPISVYRKSGNQQSNEYVLEDKNSEDKKTVTLDSEFNPCLP